MMTELTDTRLLGYIFYFGALMLIAIGLYLVVARHHAIRILLGLSLLESGVNLVLVAAGFRENAAAPVLTDTVHAGASMVDPIPQALILTTIVIGVGILALALAISVEVHRRYATLNLRKLAERIEQGRIATPTAAVPATDTAGDSLQ